MHISDLPLEMVDLREHTALLRNPFALLSEDTLEFFKGALSRDRHSEAGHIGEVEEEAVHASRTASEWDETISEPGTPKQRSATLPPSNTPAECSDVSPKSKLPSVTECNTLALQPLPTDTSVQSVVTVSEPNWTLALRHVTPT